MIPQLFMVFVALLPQVTDSTSDLVGGPATDAISKRFDTLSERIEAWQKGSTLAIEKLDKAQAGRFSELVESMRSAAEERKGLIESLRSASEERKGLIESVRELRADRDGILSRLREFSTQREGLLAKLAEIRESAVAAREEARTARREALERWTPLQNLVDRLTGFVWKLIGLVALLGVLVLITLVIVGWLYAKFKSKLLSLG